MSDSDIHAVLLAAVVAIPAIIVGILNARKVTELHVLINSNLSKQVVAEIDAAYAKGQLEGQARERERGASAPPTSTT